MPITRRDCIQAAATIPFLEYARSSAASEQVNPSGPLLPAKAAFAPIPGSYLNSASTHPFSLGARQAVEQFLRARTLEPGVPHFGLFATDARVQQKFAALINARPEELCIVQSTTIGEHLVLRALDIPHTRGRIVTDVFHFPDSFYLYEAMAKAGMDVVWVKSHDGRSIDLNDMDRAITRSTRLVAVSLVSNVNGFQHDLKQLCSLAHERGALVYADIIQAAGAVPVDVHDSNVDFAACSSYKWLMGDFGLGLLYVREDLLDRLQRSQFGYLQLDSLQTHLYPYDTPGDQPVTYQLRRDATGHFGTGTTAGACVAQLEYSLDFIRQLGVENIQRYRQPLLDKARSELEQRGYRCLTPEAATGPILSFAYPNAEQLTARLEAAKVTITLVDNRIRISPSVFNDMTDIERLIEALS